MNYLNAVTCLATALLLFSFCEYAVAASKDYSESMNRAVNRWLAVQKPSGLMPYGFDFLADEESEPRAMSAANLTRQTGTAATLADYYALTEDQRARPALERFLQAFGRYSLPIGKSRMQALVERTRLLSMPFGRYKIKAGLTRFGLLYETTGAGRVISPTTDYSKAYTGALALALLTELRYLQASGDASFAGLRQAWLEGLIGLRIPGDGFRLIPTSIDTTPYFDGEAWLALAEYHRAFPNDRRVNEIMSDVDATLMQKYGEPFKFDFYHWGTMAAAARYSDTKDKKILDFIKTQTGQFLERMKKHSDSDNNCALAEGVADALGALSKAGEGRGELAAKAKKWLATEMQKAQQLQIQPGQTEMVFSNAKIIVPRMQEFDGDFRGGIYSAHTQVDFTAHCVSALVKLERHNITFSGN